MHTTPGTRLEVTVTPWPRWRLIKRARARRFSRRNPPPKLTYLKPLESQDPAADFERVMGRASRG